MYGDVVVLLSGCVEVVA